MCIQSLVLLAPSVWATPPRAPNVHLSPIVISLPLLFVRHVLWVLSAMKGLLSVSLVLVAMLAMARLQHVLWMKPHMMENAGLALLAIFASILPAPWLV